MGLFAVCAISSCAFAQDHHSMVPINDEDIISAESINAAEEPDLSTSPATVQYRVRPFNYQQHAYQNQIRLQQQQQHQVQEEDEHAEASQEDPEEENVPQHHQQHIIQAPQQPQPAYRRPAYAQPQQAQQDHPVFRKVEQNQKRLQNRDRVREQQHKQELEDELEQEEEPDRLALLLEKSDFACNGRPTGYYADEGLGCEVFHYCADNQKHSWICPEGFSFHQVHLICMPAGSDNVCQQSSKYTFVNEYLYKPLNMEEHQQKPNVMLRYSERYFPEEIFQDERQEYDEEENDRRSSQQQYRQAIQQQQRQQPVRKWERIQNIFDNEVTNKQYRWQASLSHLSRP